MEKKKNKKVQQQQIVVKSNELIQKSRFSLSLQEQKIILFLISHIKPTDTDFKLYDFSIKEFCSVCGIDEDSGGNYSKLKKALKNISDKSLWIELEGGTETLVRWIEKPYINKHSGIISIKLDKDMKPFLLELKEKYTKYELGYVFQFKSRYTVRLYEYISSVHYDKLKPYEYIVTVEDLKKVTGAENYKETRDFKSRALNPAVKEINAYSDKNLTISDIKSGKRITHFKILIQSKPLKERLNILADI